MVFLWFSYGFPMGTPPIFASQSHNPMARPARLRIIARLQGLFGGLGRLRLGLGGLEVSQTSMDRKKEDIDGQFV